MGSFAEPRWEGGRSLDRSLMVGAEDYNLWLGLVGGQDSWVEALNIEASKILQLAWGESWSVMSSDRISAEAFSL